MKNKDCGEPLLPMDLVHPNDMCVGKELIPVQPLSPPLGQSLVSDYEAYKTIFLKDEEAVQKERL